MFVRDPRSPAPAAVAAAPPGRPGPGRRSRRVAGGLLVVLAVLAGLLRSQRAADADRQLDRVVDLQAVLDEQLGTVVERVGQTVSVSVRVRNDGPREVVLLSADVQGTRLASAGTLPIAAGETRVVPLEQSVQCVGDEPDLVLPTTPVLQLRVLTAAGERTTRLPVAPGAFADRAVAVRALCTTTAPRLVARQTAPQVREDGDLVSTLVLVNASRQQLRVRAVRGLATLGYELRVGGEPVVLPVLVEVDRTRRSAQADTPDGQRELELRVRVTRCGARDDEALRGGLPVDLVYDSGRGTALQSALVALPSDPVRALLDERC